MRRVLARKGALCRMIVPRSRRMCQFAQPELVMAIQAENKKVAELFRSGEYRAARSHAEESVKLSREAFADLEAHFPSLSGDLAKS